MIRVFCVLRLLDGDLVPEPPPPASSRYRLGDVVGPLTNIRAPDGELAPAWNIEINLGEGVKSQLIRLPLERFLKSSEQLLARDTPVCFADLTAIEEMRRTRDDPSEEDFRWLWLFRDDIYVTERNPRPSETEAVILQIKSARFHREDALTRLREQVANFEAIDEHMRAGTRRQPLSDDVKLLVWSRDGGACVRCHSRTALHFDHIIPFARGGSDEAENIQLLCRACNLTKGDRIV